MYVQVNNLERTFILCFVSSVHHRVRILLLTSHAILEFLLAEVTRCWWVEKWEENVKLRLSQI